MLYVFKAICSFICQFKVVSFHYCRLYKNGADQIYAKSQSLNFYIVVQLCCHKISLETLQCSVYVCMCPSCDIRCMKYSQWKNTFMFKDYLSCQQFYLLNRSLHWKFLKKHWRLYFFWKRWEFSRHFNVPYFWKWLEFSRNFPYF